MKRELQMFQWTRKVIATVAGLTVVCGTATSYAGWNPFAPGSPVKVGPRSGQIAIADFNGDGSADLLVNHSVDGRASLLLGDGRGEFPAAGRTTIDFGYDPGAIAVGDVNGDKRPDLAVASRDDSTTVVHIWLNSVDGKLKEFNDLGFSAGKIAGKSWKPSLALADVNGDKNLDLISANGRHNAIEVFYGSAVGQFQRGQTIVLDEGLDRYSHIIGDLNADGRLDMIAVAATSSGDETGRLTVLFGDKTGKLVAAPKLSADVPAGAQAKTLADMDGDKRLDVVLTHGDSATALIQNEKGGLAPSAGSPFAIGREAFGVVAVDAGYYGNDVLVAATVDGLDVLYADEDGQFRRACASPVPAGSGAYNVAMGDITGDGKADVVANSFEGDSLSMLLSTP